MFLVDYTVKVFLGTEGRRRVREIMLTSFIADKHANTALFTSF